MTYTIPRLSRKVMARPDFNSSHGCKPRPRLGEPLSGVTGLDPYLIVYADRAHNLRTSEIRALSAVSRWSSPAGDAQPGDLLDRLAATIRNHGAKAMQYGSARLGGPARAHYAGHDGIVGADPDDVVVTTGGARQSASRPRH